MSPQIRLHTHADDVAAVIEAEELQHAIVVGHSYGGMVITAVADRLPQRVGRLVYLDAVVPESGESWSSGHPPDVRDARRQAIARTGTVPPADPALFGLQGEDADWVRRRQTPQPGGVYDDPLQFDAGAAAALPRTFIACTQPPLATIAASLRRARVQPGWQMLEIPTGHDAMISAPQALLQHLLALS
jgi:pimeloyl-ACP methyl ester carboxylesterase